MGPSFRRPRESRCRLPDGAGIRYRPRRAVTARLRARRYCEWSCELRAADGVLLRGNPGMNVAAQEHAQERAFFDEAYGLQPLDPLRVMLGSIDDHRAAAERCHRVRRQRTRDVAVGSDDGTDLVVAIAGAAEAEAAA